MGFKIIESKDLSSQYDKRFIVVDEETNNILDDANGYGFKSARAAHACWAYKTRDKSKDRTRAVKFKKIKKWMKSNPKFVNHMEQIAFEIYKGSWGPDDKFDAKLVSQISKANNLEVDFTASELLKVWQKR